FGFPARASARVVRDVAGRPAAAPFLPRPRAFPHAARLDLDGGLFRRHPSGIFSLDWLADLSNIGTLFAFVLVSLGVIVLRRKQPERRRAFRVPWVPVIPILSVLCCFVLMASLPLETWIRLFVWLVIGLTIYFLYGRHHTEFAPRAAVVGAAGESAAATAQRGH